MHCAARLRVQKRKKTWSDRDNRRMRTTAQARRSPTARAGATAASRRSRTPGKSEPVPSVARQQSPPAAAAVGGAPPAATGPAGATAPAATEARDVPTEILLHIERAGDRLFPGRGWVGALGRRMRIEAFSIRPLERLAPADIEMKGFLPSGGETPWIPGGLLCGTRGRGLPLTGFAVLVVPQRADRVDALYQGSFFADGISDLQQNGDPCQATTADDPLEAINLRLIERVGEAVDAEMQG